MQTKLIYKIALGYAAAMATGWLTIAIRQWIIRQRYSAAARQLVSEGSIDAGRRAMEIAGGRQSEVVIALGLMVVFVAVAVALFRRTWNSWDWATAVIGLATVPSAVFLCAAGRVIYAAPFTLAPLWILLYRPGVKAACGVGDTGPEEAPADEDGSNEVVDLRREQERLIGLLQSLRVFEVERSMETDVFVARYAQGLEEDSADNDEWFALARLARRTRERLAEHNGD